jgi:DNA polymerase-3 subunit epsilon
MLAGSYVVLDLETTGLSPERGDRITEIGAVRIREGRIVERFQSLVNCNVLIPSFITAYTGITQRMVDQAPPVMTVIRSLNMFIADAPIIAHNASFDQRFFLSENKRCNLTTNVTPFICSMRVARRLYPSFRSHALGRLGAELGLGYQGSAHRAGTDAELTAQIMLRLGTDLKRQYNQLTLDAALLRRIMRMPIAEAARKLQAFAAA